MVNSKPRFYLNENSGISLGDRVTIKPGSSEWFDAVNQKFLKGEVGVVDCIGRWSGLIQVQFPSRLVNGLSPKDLLLEGV